MDYKTFAIINISSRIYNNVLKTSQFYYIKYHYYNSLL